MKSMISMAGVAALALAAGGASAGVIVGSGGGFSIFGEESERINIDITGLTGSYTSFVFTADFGGDRPNDNEFSIDARTLFRTSTDLPFSLFLEDSNFDFVYNGDVLTITENFASNSNFSADALNGGDYGTLRLDLFNDDTSRLTIESWSLELIPTPSAAGVLALGGLLAARRRR